MGKAYVSFKEVRFVMEEELTQAYVLMNASGDCPIGVQGWHHKTFPASKSIIEIVESMGRDDPALWPLKAPR